MEYRSRSMSGMNGGNSETQAMMENSKVGEILNIVYDISLCLLYFQFLPFFFI